MNSLKTYHVTSSTSQNLWNWHIRNRGILLIIFIIIVLKIGDCQCLYNSFLNLVIMAALWNRAGHYIFMLWFLSCMNLSFFPRLISAAAHWMSTVLRHMVWP